MSYVRAENLELGQRIVVGPDRVETVMAPTEIDRHGGAVIHTDAGTILTGLPCAVKVIDVKGP